jgi:telomerase reverse transcriptase
VTIRRFENISLHTVLKDIRVLSTKVFPDNQISDIPWLAPANNSTTSKMSRPDFEKRVQLFEEFIYWLFDSFIIHLLRSNFYVTETAVHKNRVFYFRHDIWRRISTPSISKLKESMLTEVSKVSRLRNETHGRLRRG